MTKTNVTIKKETADINGALKRMTDTIDAIFANLPDGEYPTPKGTITAKNHNIYLNNTPLNTHITPTTENFYEIRDLYALTLNLPSPLSDSISF